MTAISHAAGAPPKATTPDATAPKSRVARREKIIEAALYLMRRQADSNVQVRDVCERANVALGTLYRYFPSKEILFVHVYERWVETIQNLLGKQANGPTNADRLIELANQAVDSFEREPQFFVLSTALNASTDADIVACMTSISDGAQRFYVEHVDGLAEEDALDIVRVLFAVLGTQLGFWVTGRVSIADVRLRLERSIRLLLEYRDPSEEDHVRREPKD